MKPVLILTMGLCLLFVSVPVMADQAADEAAIRKAVKQVYASIKNHDAKAYVALCAENFEDWEGGVKGRAALEKYLLNAFAQGIQIKLLDEIGIVFVTPDVAIHKHKDAITGSLSADGKRLSARVFVKENNKWLFATHFYRPIEE